MTSSNIRVGLAGLALSLLAAHAARAQDDAPPADLLSHVKVGQRWTFRTVEGEQSAEEVQTVAEVHPDRVVYVVTTRFLQAGKQVFENVDTEPQEWRWGARPAIDAAMLTLTKSKQERRTLEVPGMKLDCVVTITTEPAAESWIAAKGALETYPGHVKALVGAQPFRALIKVEDGPPPTVRARAADEEGALPADALAHVKVGQRWVFTSHVDQGVTSELVWTVVEVTPAEGVVRYRVKTTTRFDGQTITDEEEEPEEWSAGGSPAFEEGMTVEGFTTARKKLEVPGLALDCYVVTDRTSDEPVEVWTAVKGDHEVFPGVVKQTVGKTAVLQLARVEQPK